MRCDEMRCSSCFFLLLFFLFGDGGGGDDDGDINGGWLLQDQNMRELGVNQMSCPLLEFVWCCAGRSCAALDGASRSVQVAGACAWWCCLLALLACWAQIGRGGACAGWAGWAGWAGLGLLKPEWAVGGGKKRRRGRWSSSNPRHCCLNRHEPLAAPAL